MGNERRSNVGPLARQFRKEGYVPTPHADLLESTPDSDEAFRAYGALKPEFYALAAIISDRIVQRAYDAREERPPFGLITGGPNPMYFVDVDFHHLNPLTPFRSVEGYMRGTLRLALREELAAKEKGEIPQEIASVYKRLDQLLAFRNDTTPALQLHSNLYALMEGGINTAAQVMSGVLEVIPQVHESHKNPHQLKKIARNSESLINLLAAQHGEVFFPAIVRLKHPPVPIASYFNPEFFQIEGEKDKQRLVLSQSGNQLLEWMRQKILIRSVSSRHEPTIGCPALFNLGDGSGIKKLWSWYSEIAEKVYPLLARGS